MILMYHKVDIITPSLWWVTAATFARQLEQLGDRKFVYLDDYDAANPEHVAITFDDAYENVYRWAFPALRRNGIPFELFVIGDWIGDWNQFDRSEPLTRFASLEQLMEMAQGGARVQWHTNSHPDLPSLADDQLERELAVPEVLQSRFPAPHLSWLAYPSGCYDDRVVRLVRSRFSGAVAVLEGQPTDRWRLNRITVDEHTVFD